MVLISNTAQSLITKGRRVTHTGTVIAGRNRCRIVVLFKRIPGSHHFGPPGIRNLPLRRIQVAAVIHNSQTLSLSPIQKTIILLPDFQYTDGLKMFRIIRGALTIYCKFRCVNLMIFYNSA